MHLLGTSVNKSKKRDRGDSGLTLSWSGHIVFIRESEKWRRTWILPAGFR
jgi:hypothetical protein